MKLKVGQPVCIVYQKDGEEPTERTVVPSYVPYPHVRTIDLSSLSLEEADEMVGLVTEYQAYYADYLKQAFNFEAWVEHTKNKTITPKWRAFKTSNIKDVK